MSSPTPAATATPPLTPLTGSRLWLAALILAAANFIAVLNMTIANVAVPHLAGALGAATHQGTWVITSYAVGEAITVPLTGWLAARFGAVRVFAVSMSLFGTFSALCGLSNSLGVLVVMRIFQGLCGGPLMPLSQTLLLRIFPKEKVGAAIGLWSMTTMVAPVVGPIVGGWICDEYSWAWVFLLNSPIGVVFGWYAWRLLKRYQNEAVLKPFDRVGLALLVLWVASLQLMLDEGKNLDWFASPEIIGLGLVALVGLAFFIVWELHEPHPIVDLRVFRHRGFTVSVITISTTFAAYFGVNVLTPLWLQSFMGYTAAIAGQATAWTGITAFFVAPFIARAATRGDPRKLVFAGVAWMGLITFWRSVATTDMAFWDVATPLIFMGLGMPCFFIPTTGLALNSVEPHETASAAGLMSFLRTLSGAFATSLVTTVWSDQATRFHADRVGELDRDGSVGQFLASTGQSLDTTRQTLDNLLTAQSIMLSTNQIMMTMSLVFVLSASLIWLAPRPRRSVTGASAH